MFDFGFGEMIVCALLALIVLGPEKLPKLARWVGRFTGQARAYMQGLSAELERESHLSDLKRQLADTERLAREHADEINRSVMNATRDGLPAPAATAPVPASVPAPVMTALPAPMAAADDAPTPAPGDTVVPLASLPAGASSTAPDAPPPGAGGAP